MSIGILSRQDVWFLLTYHAKLDCIHTNTYKVTKIKTHQKDTLVTQIKAGHKECIAALIQEHSPRLYLIILRMVQSQSAAEDILQDTWILVMRKLHQHDPYRPMTPWLTQIAINCCRSYWRKERLRSFLKPAEFITRHQDLEPKPVGDSPIAWENRQLAGQVLQRLSPKLREVIVLKFYSGLTQDEIAEVLKIPVGTVKSRLNYALNTMRANIHQGETP